MAETVTCSRCGETYYIQGDAADCPHACSHKLCNARLQAALTEEREHRLQHIELQLNAEALAERRGEALREWLEAEEAIPGYMGTAKHFDIMTRMERTRALLANRSPAAAALLAQGELVDWLREYHLAQAHTTPGIYPYAPKRGEDGLVDGCEVCGRFRAALAPGEED